MQMETQHYSVNQQSISNILGWVQSGEVAIPEIQRPFVWNATKVRDLIDSLYKGYPAGYVIIWKNPDVKIKDGVTSEGKKIIIDGQQRIIALQASLLGRSLVNKDYQKTNIKIAFKPTEERFEVSNPAISKDNSWIPDISKIFNKDIQRLKLVEEYCLNNPEIDKYTVDERITKLESLGNAQIGVIELNSDLTIDEVTEIFIRINSKGVVLSQADFAMSKIASFDIEGLRGTNLRKFIDYFCHLSVSPEFYEKILTNDQDFQVLPYMNSISWLKDSKEDLYDPSYSDMIRVAFTTEFNRGKIQDLVSLLSGRNFETREFEQSIAEETFNRLEKSIYRFSNQTNFERFLMIIKSAGFITSGFITSQNALNSAYIVYLKLRDQGYPDPIIEGYVRKWFVLAYLTSRYSGSPESQFDEDIRNISKTDFGEFLKANEESFLSESFWNSLLIQELNKSTMNNPFINTFFASQVKYKDLGFLSSDITVEALLTHRGDVHHIFPKSYLKKEENSKGYYNQVANYAFMQSEINIRIGDDSPRIYFEKILKDIESGTNKLTNLKSREELEENLKMHCIPLDIINWDVENYEEFLKQRKTLMGEKMQKYYKSL